jgi:outer membrane receptor protein involved in Fe transport
MARFHTLAAALASTVCIIGYATPAEAQQRQFNIPAGPLGNVLDAFVVQSGMQLIYKADEFGAAQSPGIRGTHDAKAALQSILKGTGFKSVADSSGAQAIVRSAEGNVRAGDNSASSGGSYAAQSEAIVVTGTHIRGTRPVGVTVVTRDRGDFERLGATSIEEALSDVPQVIASSQRAEFASVSIPNGNGSFDPSLGTGINLRGLGEDSTLTLLNGRRMPRGGQQRVVDISLIPLAAIERIDILLDGASAIYGSDAVGGVVNLITRKNFTGAETRVSAGISSRGDAATYEVSQAAGISNDRGFLFGAGTFERQNAYSTVDRPFFRDTGRTIDFDLQPLSKTSSVFLNGQYEIINNLTLNGSFAYGHRSSAFRGVTGSLTNFSTLFSKNSGTDVGATLGATYSLPNGWNLALNGTYGQNKGARHQTSVPTGFTADDNYTSRIKTVDGILSGRLFDIFNLPASFSMGSSYMGETFRYPKFDLDGSDHSKALFGEFVFPLLPAIDGQRPRARLSIAGRYEKYSKWGHTFDPKIGLELYALRDLLLSGSYGTSFRAPTLVETAPFNAHYVIFNLPDGVGITRTLLLTGNNPDLKPQTSKNLNIDLAYSPRFLPGLHLKGDYFDIKYKNRIQGPLVNFFTALTDPAAADLVFTRAELGTAFDPLVTGFLTAPAGTVSFGCQVVDANGICREPASNIGAIIDERLQNLSRVRTRGFDAEIDYSSHIGADKLGASASATYLLDYKIAIGSSAPPAELASTPYYPVKFRATASVSWQHGLMTLGALLNYVDSYENTLVTPHTRLGAFTTVGLNAQFDLGSSGLMRHGSRLLFNVKNLFDEQPPRLINPGFDPFNPSSMGYDPRNSDPMGRFYRVTFVGNW